jgi:hypothetical protein
MNEIRRTAYLEALGIDSYVSRTQLPGAARTQRLAIVSTRVEVLPGVSDYTPDRGAISALLQRGTDGARPGSDSTAQVAEAVASAPVAGESTQRSAAVPRFSLTTIVAGDWLWLEELAGPLTTEQVQLVQSMAQALVRHSELRTEDDVTVARPGAARPGAARPDIAQFEWPIHTNHQLDLGVEAARASVAGFVGRRLEQHGCRGLVLLGQSCVMRVPLDELKVLTVNTASSAEILAQPALKQSVWRDLLPLVSK